MRLVLSSLLAATLLSSPLAAAECLRPTDHVAMDVIALKTQLMVTALTCQADERYNAFIRKYQPDLQREDKSLNTYFSRSYGRSAQKQRDDYVTNLANSQSQTGLKQGSAFCGRNLGAFDEVMALKTSAELPDYAAGRAGQQPISVSACGAGAAEPTRTAAHSPARSTSRRR
jgi:hypothetical protein